MGPPNCSGGKLAISKRWDSQKGPPAGSGEVGDEILQYPLTWTHMECTWQEDGPAHLCGNCTYRLETFLSAEPPPDHSGQLPG